MPLLQNIITINIKTGEELLENQKHIIDMIQNETIREELSKSVNKQLESLKEQHAILSGFSQYSWIFIITISMVLVYLFGKQITETSRIS
jgi:hypothetical protein